MGSFGDMMMLLGKGVSAIDAEALMLRALSELDRINLSNERVLAGVGCVGLVSMQTMLSHVPLGASHLSSTVAISRTPISRHTPDHAVGMKTWGMCQI